MQLKVMVLKNLYEDQGPGLGIGYQLFSFNCINVNFNYS